jgi:hypothetical protein
VFFGGGIWMPPSPTSTRSTFTIDVFLQPGQHYLIAHTGYNNLIITANATYGTGITADGGAALLRPDNSIADQVGLSGGSAYFEGAALASLGTNADRSYERLADGSGNCIDSNNNSLDFFLRDPSDPQNLASAITLCGNPTETPSPTFSPTATNTPSSTPTTASNLSVLINEVAWAGTDASTSDEWIELYNPGGSPVNLAGWVLKTDDGSPNISLSGSIPAHGYFLLERTNDNTVSDIAADLIYSGELNNSDEILRLYDPSNFVVDTANSNGGAWPAGSSNTYGSMERRAVIADSDTAWITNTGVIANGLDANGNPLKGTPKQSNWAFTVTASPSPNDPPMCPQPHAPMSQ